jgi:hypothetical protein
MDLFQLIALILAVVVGIWAVMERSWQLLLIALAVVLLALAGEVNTRIIT